MDTRTEHDQEQDRLHQERYWRDRIREKRHDLATACPPGQVVDDDHLASMMNSAPAGNRQILLWKRFARRGLRAAGFGADYVERVMGPQPANVPTFPLARQLDQLPPGTRAAQAPSSPPRFGLYWDPPDDLVADIPEEWRAGLIGPRAGA